MASWPTGFYPFWFWNDTVCADEIQRQVREMAAQGIRGFFVHPRQGLGQPYLSERFLEMVDVAIAAAEAHGLTVHLYDEYPYPSGVAGGEVVLGSPEFYATRLVQRTVDLPGGQVRLELPRGKVLECRAYHVQDGRVDWDNALDLRPYVGMVLTRASYVETGLTAYNRRRFFASEPVAVLEAELPPGQHRVFASVQAEVDHHKYWGHYVDLLNPDAVERFVELTHQRYRARYGSRFGKSILSIFTDEVCPRWSARVPDAFEAAYGYDLCAMLSALQDESHPEHLRVLADLNRLVYRMFCESFEERVSDWCRESGLAYTGEKPSLRMAQLRYMDVPGCEPGHTKVGAPLDLLQPHLRGNAKATASAAYFYGKQGSLCECYHSTGWSATLQDAKYIADALLLMGIRYLVPHGFFYSTHGLRKHDAPPTFFFQVPFWRFFGELSAWVDGVAKQFEGTYIDAEVLVVEPASGFPGREDLTLYSDLLWALMGQHIDFHVVDTDILESATMEDGRVQVADIAAKVVLVPPMRVVEVPLRRWLDRFQAKGGRVIWCDPDVTVEAIVSLVRQTVGPSLSVRGDAGEAEEILSVKRAGPNPTLWYLLHTGDRPLDVELDAGMPLREIPLGATTVPRLRFTGERYARAIAPYEAFMVAACESSQPVPALPSVSVHLNCRAAIGVENHNLLRMGKWWLSLLDEAGRPGPAALVTPMPLPNQLACGGLAYVPAYAEYFGHVPELSLPRLRLQYEYTFECAYDGRVWLLVEPDSVLGEWSISVNAWSIVEGDLAPVDAHVRGTRGVDVTGFLLPGRNVVRLEVTTDRLDGGLLNPLYLAGSFGVEASPPRLVPLPQMGGFETYDENLLPYYAGTLTYRMSLCLETVPHGERVLLELVTDEPFHEAMELSVNGSPFQPVLWQPRCVELSTEYLRPGENVVTVRVHTTLVRAFEGQWFDYRAHRYRHVGA